MDCIRNSCVREVSKQLCWLCHSWAHSCADRGRWLRSAAQPAAGMRSWPGTAMPAAVSQPAPSLVAQAAERSRCRLCNWPDTPTMKNCSVVGRAPQPAGPRSRGPARKRNSAPSDSCRERSKEKTTGRDANTRRMDQREPRFWVRELSSPPHMSRHNGGLPKQLYNWLLGHVSTLAFLRACCRLYSGQCNAFITQFGTATSLARDMLERKIHI